MKKTLIILLVLLVVAATVFASGAKEGKAGAKGDITVVFVPKLSGNSFLRLQMKVLRHMLPAMDLKSNMMVILKLQ